MDDRAARCRAFLEDAGWAKASRSPLAGDASARRYERLALSGNHAVLMDAPPPGENVVSFATIAHHLRALHYSAPEIYAIDEIAGFMLLEDLGDNTYTRLLGVTAREAELYSVAVDFLSDLHRKPLPRGVPRYGTEKLVGDAHLFLACYLKVERAEGEALYRDFDAAWQSVLHHATDLPYALSLRDFHAGNLIWLNERNGIQRLGLLDFQDALAAPIAYDLVSLLQDARRDVTGTEQMMDRYLAANPTLDADAFRAGYAVLGVQRGLRIVGVFSRLAMRGKPEYLTYLPRVWRHVEACGRHDATAPIVAWLDEHARPARRERD